MEENGIQINGGITINVDVSVKNVMYVKKIIFRIALLYKEKYENILIYGISYKPLMGAKPMHIRFNKIDEFIKVYDGIRYLVIFDYWWCDEIYNRIRFLKRKKRGITNSINHNVAGIRIDS